jgi:hypothetical protein
VFAARIYILDVGDFVGVGVLVGAGARRGIEEGLGVEICCVVSGQYNEECDNACL